MNHNESTDPKKDFRRSDAANRAMIFRAAAVVLVLYWLAKIVLQYFKGGPDSPSLTLVIVAVILMGGGAILVSCMTYKTWKADRENAVMSAEEIAQIENLRTDADAEADDAAPAEDV